MVECVKCHNKMKRWKTMLREDHVVVVWRCDCGAFRQTKKTGRMFRYRTDSESGERVIKSVKDYRVRERNG